MQPSKGLKDSLNAIREVSVKNGGIYHQYVPQITDTTTIGDFGTPILKYANVQNEFFTELIKRIGYTKIVAMRYSSPLKVLEGDEIPLGYAGQEIYINPAVGRKFNENDFAGILQRYEADIKTQYTHVNMDLQYPVTATRAKIKNAFTSWEALESFINEIIQSLYNGAYIDEYRNTKALVSGAYLDNKVPVEVINPITDENSAKDFVKKARALFLNFQAPSTKYNAWKKCGGAGRAVTTWTQASDIVFVITNELASVLDVDVLASAFNLDRATLLGNILYVDNFDVIDPETGEKTFDGSAIQGIMCDKKWFKIRQQDMELDEWYNANNRTWQFYLNLVKMYNYSLFANGVIFSTKAPEVKIEKLDYNDTKEVHIQEGDVEGLEVNVTPFTANTPAIEYTATVGGEHVQLKPSADGRTVFVTAVSAGQATIKASAGSVNTSIQVTVEGAPAMAKASAKKA